MALFCCSNSVTAQPTSFIEKIPLLDTPVSVSIDRTSHIYVAGKKGNIYKYNSDGELLFTHSPQKQTNVKSVEAWSTLNTFVFYEGLQEFSVLDRFLTPITTQKFRNQIYARLATISSDNNLWVFDDQDYSLKKINLNYFEADILTSLNNIVSGELHGTHIREYQNFVFLSNAAAGIYVFDNFGNFIKELPFKGVSYFNFHKNTLYFLNDSKLTLFDIYSSDVKELELETEQKYTFALITEHKLFLFSGESVDVYQHSIEVDSERK